MSRRLLGMLAVLAACSLDNQAADGGGKLDFMIGTIPFHAASGAARPSGTMLGLYLTDQPDACLAITQTPIGAATFLALRVAPQADGQTTATVVPQTTAGAGQAVGTISVVTGGVTGASYTASSGSVTWTANADGSTTIVALDVGFQGTSDRLVASELTLVPCK